LYVPLSCVWYILFPTTSLHSPNSIWVLVQIMKILIMHFSPVWYYFITLRLRLPQHTLWETKFHTQIKPQAVL
jgi:hypothetical protein